MKTQDELDDVQQHSGDGGEGIADFHRSLESRDEEANTPGDRLTFADLEIGERFAFKNKSTVACGKYNGDFTKTSWRTYRGQCFTGYPDPSVEVVSLSPEIDEVERNRREDEKERIEKEWYENERSRAATADYEFEIEEDLE